MCGDKYAYMWIINCVNVIYYWHILQIVLSSVEMSLYLKEHSLQRFSYIRHFLLLLQAKINKD